MSPDPLTLTLCSALAKKYPKDFLEVQDDPTSVVRFTDLRKLALSVLAKECGYDPEVVAEEGFEAWHAARHQVEGVLEPGALQLLQK